MAEYIDREAAIVAVKQIIGDQDHECKAVMDFYCALRNIPSANVAPVVHGWWEYIGTDEKGHVFICSNCRNRIGLDAEIDFCPNCGAKMDGDADE